MSNNSLQLFEYSGHQVRTVMIEDDPWFVLSDLADVLGIVGRGRLASRLADDVRQTHPIPDSMGRTQQTTIVNEAGMYEVILRSDKPEAVSFRRWVTSEVLPSIRKTGSYGKPAELTRADLAQMVLDAEREKAELEPKAQAWDTLAGAKGDYSVAEAAQVLSRDDRITIGRNRLFEFMGQIGWLYRGSPRNSWHAYQDQVDNGRLVRRMSSAFQNQKTGELELPAPTIRVTAKGVEALRTRLLEEVAA